MIKQVICVFNNVNISGMKEKMDNNVLKVKLVNLIHIYNYRQTNV